MGLFKTILVIGWLSAAAAAFVTVTMILKLVNLLG